VIGGKGRLFGVLLEESAIVGYWIWLSVHDGEIMVGFQADLYEDQTKGMLVESSIVNALAGSFGLTRDFSQPCECSGAL
jgi:hypothetical protein